MMLFVGARVLHPISTTRHFLNSHTLYHNTKRVLDHEQLASAIVGVRGSLFQS